MPTPAPCARAAGQDKNTEELLTVEWEFCSSERMFKVNSPTLPTIQLISGWWGDCTEEMSALKELKGGVKAQKTSSG